MLEKNKIALITEIMGQGGARLAGLLLREGYIVHAIKQRNANSNSEGKDLNKYPFEENANFRLHYIIPADATCLTTIIREVQPDEIYDMGAMSEGKVSYDFVECESEADKSRTVGLLEAVRLLNLVQKTKIYQVSPREFFGVVQRVPQGESHSSPRSLYAAAKLYSY